jgi:hypothetical protein
MCKGFFFQVPKDWEVSLGVVGDEFFLFFPKKSWIGKDYWILLEML